MTHWLISTLGYTLGHLHSEALLDTLDDTIAKVEVEKPADTLCDVKALALVDVLAYMLDTERYEGRDTGRGTGRYACKRSWPRHLVTNKAN